MLRQGSTGRNEKDLAKSRHTCLGTQPYTADFLARRISWPITYPLG